MTTVGTLTTVFNADPKALLTGIASIERRMSAASLGISGAAGKIGVGFMVGSLVAVKALGAALNSVEALGSETRALQRITGQTAESASSLLYVATRLGVSSTSLQQGFGLLAKNIDLNATVLGRYDLELTNADGTQKDFNTVLSIAADKYMQLGGGMKGAAFAQELFGRGGKALIPILAQGAQGIADLEAEAARYGMVLNQSTVDQVKALAIAHRDLTAATQGLGVSIGTTLLPYVASFVTLLTGIILVMQKIPAPVMAGVLVFTALTGILLIGQKLITLVAAAWGPLIGALSAGAVAEEAAAVGGVQLELALMAEAAGAGAAATSTTAFGLAVEFALGPVGWVIAAVGLLTAAFMSNASEAANEQRIIDSLSTAIRTGGLTLDQYTHSLEVQSAIQKLTATGLISQADATDKIIGLYNQASDEAANYDQTLQGLTDANNAAADAATAHLNAELALAGGLTAILGSAQSLADAENARAAAQRKVNHMVANGKTGTDAYRQAVDDLAAANLGGIDASLALTNSVMSYLNAVHDPEAHQQQAIDMIKRIGDQLGITKGDMRAMIGEVKTYISTMGAADGFDITNTITTRLITVHGAGGTHWKAGGFHGMVTQPTIFGAGEAGAERVDISPVGGASRGSGRSEGSGAGVAIDNRVTVKLDHRRFGADQDWMYSSRGYRP